MSRTSGNPNRVEISAPALRHNLDEFRSRLDLRTRIGAVVKSNAYGHGLLETARIVTGAGADWLCVNSADEGVALREDGHRLPILVMGYVPPSRLEAVVEHDLRPVVYNDETVDALQRIAARMDRDVRVHLKAETGTQRQGVPESEIEAFAERIGRADRLVMEGLATHFANIEDTTDHAFAEQQIAAFERVTSRLAARGLGPEMLHTACSAAALLFDRTHMDLARIGISLYGLWPSRETRVSCRERGRAVPDLRPALTWKTCVAQVKDVPEGAYVGYGCTYRTTRPSRIAVLPLGYFEGYDRGLSGVAHVLVRGKRAPVRGRVCMNLCMVDVTDVPGATVEDEVVLLGTQGDESIPAEKIAEWCGTISYEIVSRIHPSLERVVVER